MAYVGTALEQVLCIEEIITIHYFEYMSNFAFSGEAHDFWEFLCVDKGEVEVRADDAFFTLHKGDVIFHKPMEFHAVKSVGGSAPNLVVISFVCRSPAVSQFENRIFSLNRSSSVILSRLIAEARLAFSTPLHLPSVEQVQRAQDAPFGAEQLVKAYLEELLICFLREYTGVDASLRRSLPSVRRDSHDIVLQKILSYLEFHICERLSVADICGENLIGRSQLQSLFHRELGCGVMDHFTRMKVERAKEIMRTSSMNFSEIAEYFSFRSHSYFSKKFRDVVGMSPSEYVHSIKGLLPSVQESPAHRIRERILR